MTSVPGPGAPVVEVLWRPGCSYCARLRSGLRRAGIPTVEHDIWSDPDAGSRVRAVTGGDETVPTVLVGAAALVNPSVRQVVAALHEQFPDRAAELLGPSGGPAGPEPGPGLLVAATAGAGLLWTALAWQRPDTTWHAAPFLMAALAPWLLTRPTGRNPLARVARVAAASAAATVALTLLLATAGWLRGPVLTGPGSAPAEAVLLAAAGAGLVLGLQWQRTRRRSPGE